MTQRRRRGFLASNEGLKKLEEMSDRKGYTQEKLAEIAGASLDQVKKLFNPHWGRRIQKDAIKKIATSLDLTFTDIVEPEEWFPAEKSLNATATQKQHSKSENLNVKKPKHDKSDSYFSQNINFSKHDSHTVFEEQDNSCPTQRSFVIGTHIDTNDVISLNLDSFLQSSVGVFGNPRTVRSFLTRLLLTGLISQKAAVNLIFDFHSDYGWEAVVQGFQLSTVKGLRHLFPEQVEIYTLDPESTRRRGVDAQELYISYDQIEVEDIKLVSRDLGLSEASLDNANILYAEYGKSWILKLINMTNEEIKTFCEEKRGHQGLIMALQRKLLRLDNLKYMRATCPQNYVSKILRLLEAGKNVVVEFGSQTDMLSYMLITNMITRRIYQHYVSKTEKFLLTKNPSDRPCQLVITIEEAHKFLNSDTVRHNIFNTIVRESWKFCITLLVVEQYPSRIDKEVISELGTRITGLLNDEDIDAIFTGVSGTQSLRSMLSKIDSTQQALIFGHGVTTPAVVRTRPYDEYFYGEVGDFNWK